MPKVSVVVPVYNVSEYLGQCLDTILLQTLQDIEVICVDDGSTDGSLDILNTYAFLDNRLKVISQKNAGSGVARNRGLKEASGEFVMFLDSDDFFEPEMLEKMVAKAEEDGSDVVVAGHYVYDNNLKQKVKEEKIEEKYLEKSPAKPADFGKDLFEICPPAPLNKLIKISLIKDNQIQFDETVHYANDVLFGCCVLANSSHISLMKELFVYYRENISTQLTSSKNNRFPDALKTMRHLYDKLVQIGGDKFFGSYIYKCYNTIFWELNRCPQKIRQKNVKLIRSELPEKVVQHLYSGNTGICVSIIIPVYNMAEFLPECLDSCLNQTLKDIEIICVDDGSTDNSLDILRDYAKRDSRITVIHQENQGLPISRNTAMDVAIGEFIQFLDADDYLESDACECLYLYSKIFGLEMCQFSAINFYHHSKKEFEDPHYCLTWLSDNFQPVFNRYMIPHLLPKIAVSACLTFYRHNFLIRQNIKWINKKIAYEGVPFFTEAILKAKRVGALKISFYHRRVHSAQITKQITVNFNEHVDIWKYTLKIVKKLADNDLFLLYCVNFLRVAWSFFAKLEPNDKVTMAPFLYDFCFTLQNKYHFTLPPDIYDWSLRYLRTLKKNKKEKLKFKTSRIKSKCVRPEYHLNLIQWQRKPKFKLSVFGIPVLYSKIIVLPLTEADKKNMQVCRNVCVKCCGLTLLKIQEVVHV